MQITNIHKRVINQPKEKISNLLNTLATKGDKVWPIELWPKMRFKNGLKVGDILDIKGESEYILKDSFLLSIIDKS
mgnify:CR=1 FL=1